MNKQTKPTDGELEILNILWQKGPSTVREVHEAVVEKKKDAGYTTTLKLMQIMLEKKMLKRNASNKTHIYEAAISQEATQGQLLTRMIENVFNGSASDLVLQALGSHKADAKELEKIKAYLEAIENKNKQ